MLTFFIIILTIHRTDIMAKIISSDWMYIWEKLIVFLLYHVCYGSCANASLR